MRKFNPICAASLMAMAALGLTGCSGDKHDVTPSDGRTRISVEMKPILSPNTRMSYLDKEGSVLTYWSEGDALRIVPSNGNESQVFELEKGAGTVIGTFIGTAPEIGDGTYTVLYPSALESADAFDTFSFEGQHQDGSSNIKGIAGYHTVKLESNTSDYTAFSFANASQSSVMVFSFRKLPDYIGAPTRITLETEDDCLAVTNSTVSNRISLELDNFTASSSLVAYLALGANPDNKALSVGKKIVVTVTGDRGSCKKTFVATADLVFAGGKRHSISVSNWDVDDTPQDKDVNVSVPSFGDGVNLDDSLQDLGGNTPGLGNGADLVQ